MLVLPPLPLLPSVSLVAPAESSHLLLAAGSSRCRPAAPSSAGPLRPAQALLLAGGAAVPYDKLCICAGARPKRLPAGDSPHVIYLRDTQSLEVGSRACGQAPAPMGSRRQGL